MRWILFICAITVIPVQVGRSLSKNEPPNKWRPSKEVQQALLIQKFYQAQAKASEEVFLKGLQHQVTKGGLKLVLIQDTGRAPRSNN